MHIDNLVAAWVSSYHVRALPVCKALMEIRETGDHERQNILLYFTENYENRNIV